MKHFELIIILVFLSLFCDAQITTREIITKEAEKPLIFDSTFFGNTRFDLVRGELKKNIGQKIYILPISKKETARRYSDFFYVPYYSTEHAFNVVYDSLANHVLTILNADFMKSSSSEWYTEWYLKLLYRNQDTIYYVAPYRVGNRSYEALPFILTAYFEKSKKQFLNKTFIEKKEITTKDINTGEEIVFSEGEKWDCIDVTLVDLEKNLHKFYTPILIFKNSKGNEILVNFAEYNFDSVDDITYVYQDIDAGVNDFYTLEEYKLSLMEQQEQERLEMQRQAKIEQQKQATFKKFGYYYGKLINDEKVAIRMTKEMCELSWGKPFRKDQMTTESGKYELWQYDYKTFLYFEGDTLKIIKQ
jgi:hypothetical protein